MKLFTACLATETNTFSPVPTGLRAFEEYGIYRGDGSAHPEKSLFGPLLGLWKGMAEGEGYESVESLCVFAQPSGLTPRALYEEFRDVILEDLKAALPVDMVLFSLHGAMVADGYDDCEGDILTEVRALVGPECVVGAIVDPHCHTSAAMLEQADVLIAYKEYPHTDVAERAIELYNLCAATQRGEIKPVTRAYDCKTLGLWRTLQEPTKSFVAEMKAMEGQDGVLSVSFGHGFPWADVPDGGAKVWAVVDGDAEQAEAVAKQLSERVVGLREAGVVELISIDAAIDQIGSAPEGLIVMADVADNAGGGAMTDSTFILERFLERGVTNAALGFFWDMGAVEICQNAGVGTELKLRVGGKCGPSSGRPLDLVGTVRAINTDHVQPGLGGSASHLGTSVWFETAGLDLILTSIRAQVFSPQAYEDLGIELAKRRVVVVKSSEHFSAGFGPIAAETLYIDTPGALQSDFKALVFERRAPDYWPRVEVAEPAPFP
ncbi:MAG: M81 family metallopeptidase [Henriciella sp.]|nr:M81 family metallopeptidase [Henriciella sp.]